MASDRVRVLRLIEYDGPREWVEASVRAAIHGTKTIVTKERGLGRIVGVTITQFPEVLEQARTKEVGADE